MWQFIFGVLPQHFQVAKICCDSLLMVKLPLSDHVSIYLGVIAQQFNKDLLQDRILVSQALEHALHWHWHLLIVKLPGHESLGVFVEIEKSILVAYAVDYSRQCSLLVAQLQIIGSPMYRKPNTQQARPSKKLSLGALK